MKQTTTDGTNGPAAPEGAADGGGRLDPRDGVRYFDELTNMAMLTEEEGRWSGSSPAATGSRARRSDRDRDLGMSSPDVLFVVLCLANQTGVDLDAAWRERMAAKTTGPGQACRQSQAEEEMI